MKKFTKIMSAAVLAAASLSLSGCQEEDFGFDAKEIAYKKNFKSVFGDIVDANQTWSTATRAIVEANVNMPGDENYTLKVYTANPRIKTANAKLLGEWSVGSSSETSHVFNIPASLKNVWVAVVNANGGRYIQEASIDSGKCSANFSLNLMGATRAAAGISSSAVVDGEGNVVLTEFPLGDYFNQEGTGFLQTYRESSSSGGHINYDEGLCTDFEFVATGDDIVMTTFYTCTSATDQIKGFYYYPQNGEKVENFYNNEDRIFTITADQKTNFSWKQFSVQSWYGDNIYGYNNNWVSAVVSGNTVGSYNSISTIYSLWGPNYIWVNDEKTLYETVGYDFPTVRSQSYRVSGVPAGAHVVFFLQNSTNKSYTRSALNTTVTYTDLSRQAPGLYAGLIPSQIENTYIVGFEDALGYTEIPNKDYDINDAVFAFTGGLVPEDHEDEIEQAQSWMIAYEDLGGSFDYDFNDVVLKVTSVAGRSTATISVMAAGGTLPVALTYDEETLCGNIHEAFGVANETIVNAASGQHTAYAPKSFTVTGLDGENPFTLSKVGISVNQGNGSISTIYAPQYYLQGIGDEAIWVGTEDSKKDKTIPYAILIGSGNWDWPDETISITTQTGFIEWVQNASKTNWYDSDSSDPANNNIWGGPHGSPAEPVDPDSEDGVQVKTIANSVLSAYSSTGAVITFTISNYAAAGTIALYSEYTDEENNTPLEDVRPSSTADISAEGTVTLTLSAGCEAFVSGLVYVYDNTKFKVSSYTIEAVVPSKGEEIEINDETSTSYYWSITKDAITSIVGTDAVDVILTCEISGSFNNMIVGNGWTQLEGSSCTINDSEMIFEFNTSKISGTSIAISGGWTANSSKINKAYLKVKE